MADSVWPVSVKGVVIARGHVLLLENDRDEWELPGGRLEPGESPQQCVTREIAEETGLEVEVSEIIDSWVYPVLTNRSVLIVTYGCRHLEEIPTLVVSSEHRAARFVATAESYRYKMPEGYRDSIRAWS